MTTCYPSFSIIAVTPAFSLDPAIAIAAARAGVLGVLDLEFANPEQPGTWAALERLASFAPGPLGIKLAGGDHQVVARMTDAVRGRLGYVIVTAADEEPLRAQLAALRAGAAADLRVFLEVTCREEAELGHAIGVDALIAKGNEAGGRVGSETAFILLQRLLGTSSLPVYVHGGIGPRTIGAVYAAGAAGVVLDYQLALARESALPRPVKQLLERMDGSETVCVDGLGQPFRLVQRRGHEPTERLMASAAALPLSTDLSTVSTQWRAAQRSAVDPHCPQNSVWPIGQDGCFASRLATAHRTLYGIIQALRQALAHAVEVAARLHPLAAGAPLAVSHGTRYPIVQGPMTRVSDRAEFAARVAEAGALPFLALALMRASDAEPLLNATREAVGDRPWGVGILGFVEPELRREQVELVRRARPGFALIAGGKPEQALELEADGIPTYLHVPSPGLLRLFLDAGARRFVFEGRECGGHVGPRSSFVLWEEMISVLLDALPASELQQCHLLFAGGIHDARSAAMVSVLGAGLAERGCRIGVLVGSAYLFTREAVETGAVVSDFQAVIRECAGTIELESGPGQVTRCAQTPIAKAFREEKQRLAEHGAAPEEVRARLEEFNIGRLRIASKGVVRNRDFGKVAGAERLCAVDSDYQRAEGLYMIGQVAGVRDQITTMAGLHEELSEGASQLLKAWDAPPSEDPVAQPAQIAIVGMGCILPKATGVKRYWENILDAVDAVEEVPEDRWDWQRYYDPDPTARDKIYSKWGGFIKDYPFDPLRYGIPPNTLASIEPLHLLALEAVRSALEDAGYPNGFIEDPELRRRTSVIIGAGGGTGALGQRYAVRTSLPSLIGEVPDWILDQLPEWTEDSFAGVLLNVTAGRVANRFDLGGVNFTVDAACGSSLAAVNLAVRELETGHSDMVIVGGADSFQNPFDFMAFSKTRAFSPRGRCRTFDADADGIAISEGVTVVVLRRLSDAEREGARIYALIQGTAGSSDGRDKSLTAPRPQGQARALNRAYGRSGIDPASVGLIEAHGTGTTAGDRAEVETLSSVFGAARAEAKSCGLGSVKSMIGHTKAAAGTAGLIKMALALRHQVLPQTLNVERPNPVLAAAESPFYVLGATRPWIARPDGQPRRAGVSAFGFGGTNFHAVLEEYRGAYAAADEVPLREHWPAELMVFSAESRAELAGEVGQLLAGLGADTELSLRDLGYSLLQRFKPQAGARLTVVAGDLDQLRERLSTAATWLGGNAALASGAAVQTIDPRGVFFSEDRSLVDTPVAFLFPGQGSQYPNMLRDLALFFPQVRDSFADADRVLAEAVGGRLSDLVFPPHAYTDADAEAQRSGLTRTEIAQPAIGAASLAMLSLLESFGLVPAMVAGHSYGEYVALHRAGVLDEPTLLRLSEFRGRCIVEAAGEDLGTMASVGADVARVNALLEGIADVQVANRNAPDLTVIAGTSKAVAAAMDVLERAELSVRRIPVACGFHSPCVAPASERLAAELARTQLSTPNLPVFSNVTAAPYPAEPAEVLGLLSRHLVSPVNFVDQVIAMYEGGARVFVEVGPNTVLSKLVGRILDGRPHLALASDSPQRHGLVQLLHLLGQLAAAGIDVDLGRLFANRSAKQIDVRKLQAATAEAALGPNIWLVNGGYVRRATEPRVSKRTAPQGALELTASAPTPTPTPTPAEPPVPPVPPVPPAETTASLPRPDQPVSPPAPGLPLPAMAPAGASAADSVMAQYLQVTNQFLETQTQVMLAYLHGRGHRPAGVAGAAAPAPLVQARQQPDSRAVSSAAVSASAAVPPAIQAPTTPAKEPPPPIPEPSSSNASSVSGASAFPGEFTVPDESAVRTALLDLVGERTGYPPEMLDLELNIEADLGIDSIKRTEILGAFRKRLFPDGGDAQVRSAVEQAAQERTLRGIIDCFVALAVAGEPQETQVPQVPQIATAATGSTPGSLYPEDEPSSQARAWNDPPDLPRFLIGPEPRPLGGQPFVCEAGSLFLLTDDETGVASLLAEYLRERGAVPQLLRHDAGCASPRDASPSPSPSPSPAGASEGGIMILDLTDPSQVRSLRDLVPGATALAGVFHCLPLRSAPAFEALSLDGWREMVRVTTKSLFNLAMAFHDEFGAERRRIIVAGTRLGGDLGISGGALRADQAGPGGLLKTLAKEWPAAHCRCVDFEQAATPAEVAGCLLAEAVADADPVEVGYQAGQRLCFTAREAALAADAPQIQLDAGAVLLITGGARGITAEIAQALARHYQPTLILCGSSPPPGEEADDIRGITDVRELKARLTERLRRSAAGVQLAQIESDFRRVQKEREIRASLEACRSAGAKVEYHAVDVRDEQGLSHFIDQLYQRFGRIDGVVHGAGIVEDRLIGDKTGDSFDRVVETKVASSFVLSRALRPQGLQFLAFFTSVAGRFGNRGQSDYAAANEILSKLALDLDRRWPTRVVAFSWGPWDKTGMVSPEIKQQFASLGIVAVPPVQGCAAFDWELRFGRKGDAEVVWGEGPWRGAAGQ